MVNEREDSAAFGGAPPFTVFDTVSVGDSILVPTSWLDDRLTAMAEPTLKNVLHAIAKLDAKVVLKVDELRSEIGGLRAEMTQRFDELDAELTLHAKVHRKIEDDITALRGRPPRTAARPARRPRAR